MKFGAILALVAMASFSVWPLRHYLSVRNASAALQARTKALVEAHPELKAAWNIAMMDGKLTWPEAKEILESKGEKVEPE